MFLCDTNIVSEVMERQPNPIVEQWLAEQPVVAISTIITEEIYNGLAYKSAAHQENWFENFLQTRCDIFPVTDEIAEQAGRWRGEFRKQGITRTQSDLLIAATAYIHRLTLATRNTKDFQECDIALFNPFTEI